MNRRSNNYLILEVFSIAAALVTPLVQAQTYPVKPIRIISPYTAGGLGDLVPRAIGAGLTEALGRQVLVENRPGAAGNNEKSQLRYISQKNGRRYK